MAGQALRIMRKNYISFFGMWKVHGINAWNTFVLRVKHPYILRKSEKSLVSDVNADLDRQRRVDIPGAKE